MQNIIYRGDLIVTKSNAEKVAHITEVTGSLSIKAKGASLPGLQSVRGSLYIDAKGAALPVLHSDLQPKE